MSEEEILVEKPRKAPILPGVVAAILVGGIYAAGHFTATAPMDVSIAMPEDEMMEEEADTGPVPRRYVSFPMSLTAQVPKWGTLLIDIGMAVHEELPMSVTDAFLTDTAPLAAPLSEALLIAVEDPDAKDLESIQKMLPPLLKDALNGVISTEDLPDPVLEVYLLKLITTG